MNEPVENIDYCLRFSSQAEMNAALIEAGYPQNDDGNIALFSPEYAIDIIGVIYSAAVYGPSGEVITPPSKLNGYHVNIRTIVALPESLNAYLVFPLTPNRVWA